MAARAPATCRETVPTSCRRKPSTVSEHASQRSAADQCHDREERLLVSGSGPNDAHQMWMANGQADAGFAAEELNIGRVACRVGAEHLDGPGLAAVAIHGGIDVTGRATSEPGAEEVAAQAGRSDTHGESQVAFDGCENPAIHRLARPVAVT